MVRARSLLADQGRTGRAAWAVLAALGLAVLGPVVGVLWSLLSPRAQAVTRGGGVGLADDETKAFIAADGLLFLLGAGVGVLAAVLLLRLASRAAGGPRSGAVLAGLLVGSALASLLAWRTGLLADDPSASRAAVAAAAQGGPPVSGSLPLRLRAYAALLGWPAGAAVGHLLVVLGRSQRAARAAAAEDVAGARAHEDAPQH